MVITFSGVRANNGPRPIDPNRDFPQLVRLLRTVFADELDSGSRSIFDTVADSTKPAVMWRFDPFLSKLTPGFVWEQDGKIVGNVTLLPTRSQKRFVVANVAIDRSYRRRGIARALMDVVDKEVRRRGGTEIRLQVEASNEPAKMLYRSLGYVDLGSVTTWRFVGSQRHSPLLSSNADGQSAVHELPPSRWREAYEVDVSAFPADLHWPEPLPRTEYRRTIGRRIANFFSGKQMEAWVVWDDSGRIAGLAGIKSEWGRAHQLFVRARIDRRGDVEGALLLKLLRRMQYLPRRRIYMLHNSSDMVLNQLLPEARFEPERELAQMRLGLE